MITLDFSGPAQDPADFTPDYAIPTGFQAGSKTDSGLFTGVSAGISAGWISTTFLGPNNYSEIQWGIGPSTDSRGPIFVNASGNGYFLLVTPSLVRLFRITSGSLVNLTSHANSVAAGDWFKLEYLGSGDFVYYKNGTQVGSHNDTVHTTDLAPGFVSRDAAGWIDAVNIGSTTEPTISDVNTTNEIVPGETATITGTNFTTATGVTVDGVVQTELTVVNDTTVTFTTTRGGNPYDQALTLELSSPNGNVSASVTQVAGAGQFVVTAASPDTTDDASFWEGLVDTSTGDPVTIVNGDQGLAYDFAALEGENISFSIDPTGNITAEFTGTFKAIIWLASEGVWGGEQTISYTTTVSSGPAVSTVNVPTAGSYGIGDTLSFTANFGAAVTVSGAPRLPVNLTTGTVYADYASGTGTTAIVFSYTVQEGDNDANGISLGSLQLNGGTIQDGSSNNATLTLAGVENTTGVLVDGVRPVITVAGDNPYNMTVGDTYVEQGATASDNQDGSLGSVTGTGTVGGTEGQYTITYPGAGVVDSAGNVALDAIRTVNVVAESVTPNIDIKKRQNQRRRYAANCYGAWRNRFRR